MEKPIDWEDWREMYPGQTWPVFCAARREIARLQAIIDKLPKCWRLLDGKLVQDVPVMPGMKLLCNGDWWEVESISNTGAVRLADYRGGTRYLSVFGENCHNSREAAEAAEGEESVGKQVEPTPTNGGIVKEKKNR